MDVERWRRIKLTIAAYAYEFENESIMPDADFDKMCLEVDLSVDTGRPDLDAWWRENFDPYTGQWIRKHPDLEGARSRYLKHFKH